MFKRSLKHSYLSNASLHCTQPLVQVVLKLVFLVNHENDVHPGILDNIPIKGLLIDVRHQIYTIVHRDKYYQIPRQKGKMQYQLNC